MKTVFVLLVALLVSLPLSVHSQCESTTFTPFEQGDPARANRVTDMLILEDGSVMILWEKDIDGDPWTNFDSKIMLSKTNNLGEIQWEVEYGTSLYDSSGEIFRLENGDFMISGSGRSYTGGTYPSGHWSVSYVWRIDGEGNEIWLETFAGDQQNGQNDGRELTEGLNGNVISHGLVQHQSGCSGYAYRMTSIDTDGNMNWSICDNHEQYTKLGIASFPATNSYLYGVPDPGGCILKALDTSGNEIDSWSYFPSWLTDSVASIRGKIFPDNEGGYYLAGWASNEEGCGITKFNSDHTVDWEVNFPISNSHVSDVEVLANNSVAISLVDLDSQSSTLHFIDAFGAVSAEEYVLSDRRLFELEVQNSALFYGGEAYLETGSLAIVDVVCPMYLENLEDPISCNFDYLPSEGLVAYYPFCGNANDESGNGNDGTINGASLTTDPQGNPNAAMEFDGVDDFIEIMDNPSLDFSIDNSMSVSYWVNLYSLPPGSFLDIIMSKQSGSGNSQTGFNVNQNSEITMSLTVGNNGGLEGIGVGLIPLQEWHHVVLIWDNGTRKSYLDGQLIDDLTATQLIGANNENLLIGKANWNNPNAQHFHGALDEVAFYNRALTQEEVLYLYWQDTCNPCLVNWSLGDLNCDGEVNMADLLTFLPNFGMVIE